jgi:IS1 family transposase
MCNNCQRQFVENPTNQSVSEEKISLINRLLLEKLSLAGIARVAEVSERWLQSYVNEIYKSVEKYVKIVAKKRGSLTIQCDELWSFVGNKNNKQWIWLAIDVRTKEIVGVSIGDRDKKAAQALWDSLPGVYRQCAVSYTDFWESYAQIFPRSRHRPVEKKSGKTTYIERLNNTIRQRVSRLVRKTLSFSKKLENHIGAIWLFVHHYNAEIAPSIAG